MRGSLVALFLIAAAGPAMAEPDLELMDLTQGLWSLAGGDGQFCDIALGDRPAKENARVIDDAGDCRNLVPAMANATAWRIDQPGTLVFLSDSGKALLKLRFDDAEGEFRSSDDAQPLVMSPLD